MKKKTIIKPLFKQGNANIISDYRPISLISNIAKIVEKRIKKRLLVHLNKHNIISDYQFGFREGKSTVDAMYNVTSYLYQKLNNNQQPLAIFLDLAKTFDTVSHEKLLKKFVIYTKLPLLLSIFYFFYILCPPCIYHKSFFLLLLC